MVGMRANRVVGALLRADFLVGLQLSLSCELGLLLLMQGRAPCEARQRGGSSGFPVCCLLVLHCWMGVGLLQWLENLQCVVSGWGAGCLVGSSRA